MALGRLFDMAADEFLIASVHIDRNNINGEFLQVAAQFAYWNEKYAEAQRAQQIAELDLKKLIATVHVRERARLIEEAPEEEVGTGKNVRTRRKLPNADDVAQAVEGTLEVQNARQGIAEASVEAHRLGGVCSAVRTKKDMLIAYGSMLREEMRGDPSIRAEQRERTSFEQQEEADAGGGSWRSRQMPPESA